MLSGTITEKPEGRVDVIAFVAPEIRDQINELRGDELFAMKAGDLLREAVEWEIWCRQAVQEREKDAQPV